MEQAVDPGAAGVQVLDEAADGGLVREVQGRGLGAERGEGGELRVVAPGRDDVRAGVEERAGGGPARVARGARDQDGAVGQGGQGQASVPRIPAVDSMTPRIFFSRASKNMDSGNSSSSTRSV